MTDMGRVVLGTTAPLPSSLLPLLGNGQEKADPHTYPLSSGVLGRLCTPEPSPGDCKEQPWRGGG